MATISVCMIVKNEERHLQECLESVRPFVDEVVVVDTGSNDGTLTIAGSAGARVFHCRWTGDFSAARNMSIEHATGDWILYIDADERLKNGGRLRELTDVSSAWAYSVLIRGKHHLPAGVVDQANAYPRLFRRHPAIRFEGMVHEQVYPSIQRLGKRVDPSDLVIDHHGYSESLDVVREKCRRNITLLEAHIAKNPQDMYAYYQLGNTLVVLQEYPSAERYVRMVIESRAERSIKASALNLMVEIAISYELFDDAERYCVQSIDLVPTQSMARWFLSGILAHKKKYYQATVLLKQLKAELGTFGPTRLSHDIIVPPADIDDRLSLCYNALSEAAMSTSDFSTAEEWIVRAECDGVHSYALQRRGLELALARKDVAASLPRLTFVLDHLPEGAEMQRAKLTEIRDKLNLVSVIG